MAVTQTPNSAYIGLARRYRPQNFADMVGQDQIAHSIEQQISQGKVSQAYIFNGPRGIGKTSTARILAKCLNCVEGPTARPCGVCDQCRSITNNTSMDVIEIDGASNNSVDDIRNLQETVVQNPLSARKKVYIIDEVHMLSRGAFNALLKTLEEPPPFVIFIFATTEPEKIPETIKSRCQVFQFRRISMEDLIRRLEFVAEAEEIPMDPGEKRAILEAIAFSVDGGLRDAMMALDQIAALSDDQVRLEDTVRFLGVVEHELLIETVEWLREGNTKALLEMVNALVERGRDLERFVKNLLGFLRDLMVIKAGSHELVHLSEEKLARAKGLLWVKNEQGQPRERISYAALMNYMQVFMDLEARMKEAVQVRVHLEFALVKLSAIEPVLDIQQMIAQAEKGGLKAPAKPADPPAAQAEPKPAPAKPTAPPPQKSTPDLFNKKAVSPPTPTEPSGRGGLQGKELWNKVVEQRKQLGMGLGLAVKDCLYKSQDGRHLVLSLPKGSLSAATVNSSESRQQLSAFLQELSGGAVEDVRLEYEDRSGATEKPQQPATQTAFQDSTPVESPSEAMRLEEAQTIARQMTQSPAQRLEHLLGQNPDLAKKVKMAQSFFEGVIRSEDGEALSISLA